MKIEVTIAAFFKLNCKFKKNYCGKEAYNTCITSKEMRWGLASKKEENSGAFLCLC